MGDYWGITKDSITIERIESFLVENADNLIDDSTDDILEASMKSHDEEEVELSKVCEYFKRNYPNQYQRNLTQQVKSSRFKSLNSF